MTQSLAALALLSLVGCAASIGDGASIALDAAPSSSDPSPDAAIVVDGAGAMLDGAPSTTVDDLSRCASGSLIKTERSQLMVYNAAVPTTEVTLENYPVSQIRPVVGVPGFGPELGTNTLAIRVRVPASYTSANPDHLGFVHVAEAPGQPVTAHALCLATNACDFTGCPDQGDTAPGVNFTVAGPSMPGTVNLQPGQVFWINVAHRTVNGTPSCPSSTCGVLVDFASPNRY